MNFRFPAAPVLVVLAAALSLGGCQNAVNTPPAPEPTNNAANNAQDDARQRELQQRREQVEREALASVGKGCAVDYECPLYLRCIPDTCQVPPAVDGAEVPDAPVVSIVTQDAEAQFFVELATDNAQRARGLMHRPRMSDQWGMIFIYPNDQNLSFWMKNTLIPLDMVFINDNNEVAGVVKNAEPLTLSSRSPGAASRFVLEINAGLADQYGIKAGDKVNFVRLPQAD